MKNAILSTALVLIVSQSSFAFGKSAERKPASSDVSGKIITIGSLPGTALLSEPDPNSKKITFLLKGEVLLALSSQNGYVKAIYAPEGLRVKSGFVAIKDIGSATDNADEYILSKFANDQLIECQAILPHKE